MGEKDETFENMEDNAKNAEQIEETGLQLEEEEADSDGEEIRAESVVYESEPKNELDNFDGDSDLEKAGSSDSCSDGAPLEADIENMSEVDAVSQNGAKNDAAISDDDRTEPPDDISQGENFVDGLISEVQELCDAVEDLEAAEGEEAEEEESCL